MTVSEGKHMRKIESLRIDKGVSIQQMADDFGVSIYTIYNWQKDQLSISAERVVEICKYFDITASEFLGID